MKKVFFIASSGGHLKQLLMLEPMFNKYNPIIIVSDSPANHWLKNKYPCVYNFNGTTKGRDYNYYLNIIRNFAISFKIFVREKPEVIISTGSNIVLPFFIWSKILGIKSIYILTFARIQSKSRGSKLFNYLATHFVVQWEPQKANYPNAKYFGPIY